MVLFEGNMHTNGRTFFALFTGNAKLSKNETVFF